MRGRHQGLRAGDTVHALRRARTLGVVVLLTVGFVIASATAAWAYLSASSTGSALATAGTVTRGRTPTATVSGRDVTLSWPSSTLSNGTPVREYIITKTNVPGSLAATLTTSCAGTVSLTSCADKGLAENGASETTWTYTVTPDFDQWKGAPSPGVTVTVPGPALSLKTTSFTTGGGTTAATVKNYFDTETVYFCVTADLATTCPSADRAGTATVPASGGTTTKTITIPRGLPSGTHTLYAKGSDGSNPTGVSISVTDPPSVPPTVTPTSIAGISLVTTTLGGGTISCVTAHRTHVTCIATGVSSPGVDTKVALVNATGTPVANATGATITVAAHPSTATTPIGTVTPTSATIAAGQSATSKSFTLAGLGTPWVAKVTFSVTIGTRTLTLTVTAS